MTIRIKGKYIVLTAVLLLLVCLAVYANVSKAIAARDLAEAEKELDSLDEYFRQLLKLYPNPEEAARELYFSAQGDGGAGWQGSGLLYIFPGSTGMPGFEDDLPLAVAKYKLLLEHFPQSPWAAHTLGGLGRCYYQLGEYDLAEEHLLLSIEKTGMEAAGSTELLARLYMGRGDYEAALKLVEKSLAEKPDFLPLEMLSLKGKALMALARWEEARRVFEELSARAEELYSHETQEADGGAPVLYTKNWTETAQRYLDRIEILQQSAGNTGIITGRVLVGGQGLAGAHVYLIDKACDEDYFTGDIGDLAHVITSADGEFRFDGLVPGRYALGIGVHPEDVAGHTLSGWQEDLVVTGGDSTARDLAFVPVITTLAPVGGSELAGKVTFSWTAVEGAVSYRLVLGPVERGEDGRITSSYRTALKVGLKNNSIEIDLDEEIKKARFSGSIMYSEQGISPRSILGLLHYGGEFMWGVEAYDAHGNRINNSFGGGGPVADGDMPLFKIANQGALTPADRLLLAREYDRAVAAYKKALENNPADTHALLVLARLHQYGVRRGEADYQKAAYYYERLLAVEDLPEARRDLAAVYLQGGENRKAYDMYHTLLDTPHETWDIYHGLSKAAFRIGRPLEALALAEQAIDMEYGQYARAYPVALVLLLGEPGKALEMAKIVDGGDNYRTLLEEYQAAGLNISPAAGEAILAGEYRRAAALESGDCGLFVQGLLVYLEGRQDYYEEISKILKQMNDIIYAKLLKALTL